MTSVPRGYTQIDDVRDFLKSINVDAISSDEEIQKLIYDAAAKIEDETRRRFDSVTVEADRYDDPGVSKLVLRNWPVISVGKVRFYDHSNTLMMEWLSTDPDWTQKVIIDSQNGFLEFPILKLPFVTAIEMFKWRGGAAPAPLDRPRLAEFKRMGYAVAWVEIDYTYGFTEPPRPIAKACTKMVAAELLGKKGAVDSQGTSSMSIAGFGETWAQGGPQITGPYASQIGSILAEVKRTFELYSKRRSIAISIL